MAKIAQLEDQRKVAAAKTNGTKELVIGRMERLDF
jgi:hypothetical protein